MFFNKLDKILKAMFTHSDIWAAIDALAARHHTSPSGLAKLAGLDTTTFNKSKRIGRDGRKRWPSTESLARILGATGFDLAGFGEMVGAAGGKHPKRNRPLPLIAFGEACQAGVFDAAGLPARGDWNKVQFPCMKDEDAYALEIVGAELEPVYRDGDIIVVSPGAGVRRGDRVVIKLSKARLLIAILVRRTADHIEVASLHAGNGSEIHDAQNIRWLSRIVWASQ